jgi:hypothetical protein
MAEIDVFERRLRTALLRHVKDGPTDFDALGFARQVAAEEPRRHGLGAILGWRRVVVPRAVWVLLLLAALLAMVAGTLAVGSQLQRRLSAVVPPVVPAFVCPPGSNPDAPGPAGRERPLAGAVSGPIAFDRAAGRIVFLTSSPRATWTFDVCSNSWTWMQLGSGPDTDFALVYDPGTDLTIGVDAGGDPAAPGAHAWAYDLDANTWTRRRPAPDHVVRLWYDAAGAQVVAWATRSGDEPGAIWTYDVASDAWAAVGALEIMGGFGWNNPGNDLLAYDASVDRLVATATMSERGIRTRLFDLNTGRVVDARAIAPWAGHCGFMARLFCYDQPAGEAIAYDERSEQVVVLIGGRVFAYDAVADRWDTLSGDPGAGAIREAGSMVYDPVNGRLIVFPGGLDFPGDSVLAFDATTRAWTILLEASDVPRAPSSR